MMRISYNLTKGTTKTENYSKILKTFNILVFMTIRNKLITSDNIDHLILNYNIEKPVSFLRLPNIKKQKQQIQKKLSEKSVGAIEKELFNVNFSITLSIKLLTAIGFY